MITIDKIKSLCQDFGWNHCDAKKFRLAWEMLKLARLEEDIIVNYLNETM